MVSNCHIESYFGPIQPKSWPNKWNYVGHSHQKSWRWRNSLARGQNRAKTNISPTPSGGYNNTQILTKIWPKKLCARFFKTYVRFFTKMFHKNLLIHVLIWTFSVEKRCDNICEDSNSILRTLFIKQKVSCITTILQLSMDTIIILWPHIAVEKQSLQSHTYLTFFHRKIQVFCDLAARSNQSKGQNE